MISLDGLGERKVIIGMVHLGALPGTPYYGVDGDFADIKRKAVADARALAEGGAHAALVQNRGDRVLPRATADPVVIAAMTDIVRAVTDAVDFPVGVQVLRNDLRASLAIARICGGAFLRCGVFAGASYSSSGIIEGDPYTVLNYRRAIGAEKVRLIAEINSMHFKAVVPRPEEELAADAAFSGADAVGVCHPDAELTLGWVRAIKKAHPALPIIIGGYTNADNIARYLEQADGAIVGGSFEDQQRGGAVDAVRVRAFMQQVG